MSLLAGGEAAASQGAPPPSTQRVLPALPVVQALVLAPTDVQAELALDAQSAGSEPLRFARPQTVLVTPATHGTWEELPEGRLWRLRVVSAGATDLNFGFTNFWLPEGATLHLSSETAQYYQGPYTARDNKPHGQLWTALIPGEAAVVELFVPRGAAQEARLVLAQVGTGYRDWFKVKGPPPITPEGKCNNDVVCPAGVPWTNEIRSVGVYTLNGAWTCTGTLIADVAGDFRNFFLTANHCGLNAANAPTVVVYWNFQSPTCGTHGPGSLSQNQTGALFRAARYDCDFALLELDEAPEPAFRVYYSGWDRSGTPPLGGVGIHHPSCDVKAISLASTPLVTVNSCIGTGGAGTHWQVTWDSGVTEPGSSGSGIWDPVSHQLAGILSGGASACGTPNAPDCYGKFAVAWSSGSSPAERLGDWLDALNTGALSLAGTNPIPVAEIEPAGSVLTSEGCDPANGVVNPGETVSMRFFLTNIGTLAASNLVATLIPTNGVIPLSGPQRCGTLATNAAALAASFTFIAAGVCGGTIAPTVQLAYGETNLVRVSYALPLGLPRLPLAENFDGVAVPALPAGWSCSPPGSWTTTTAERDSLSNSAFTADPASVSDRQLFAPSFTVQTATAQAQFQHHYSTESGYDGCVLEIAIAGGAFVDILSAGGSFLAGGYNGTIPSAYGNPLAGRPAWTGDSGGFVTTMANLPAAAAGNSVQLRWRLGSDAVVSSTGWYVDSLAVTDGYGCCGGPAARPRLGAINRPAVGWLQFSVIGTPGYAYVVEASADLVSWQPVFTNTTPYLFSDNEAPTVPARFYRARFQP